MTAPRLVSEGGNLKIYPAYGKNISFEVFGRDSWINIGDINLIKLLENVSLQISITIQLLKHRNKVYKL